MEKKEFIEILKNIGSYHCNYKQINNEDVKALAFAVEYIEKETALELEVQEQSNCAYLGCNNIGAILDDVEVATNQISKKLVCLKHKGKLNTHIIKSNKL